MKCKRCNVCNRMHGVTAKARPLITFTYSGSTGPNVVRELFVVFRSSSHAGKVAGSDQDRFLSDPHSFGRPLYTGSGQTRTHNCLQHMLCRYAAARRGMCQELPASTRSTVATSCSMDYEIALRHAACRAERRGGGLTHLNGAHIDAFTRINGTTTNGSPH